MRPPRILLTVPSLDPDYGGPARTVPALVDGLRAHGVDASAQVGSEGAWTSTDLVHDNGIWQLMHRAVARTARAQRTPRIVSPRGMLEPWAFRQKRWRKRLAWYLYQRRDLDTATALHATSEEEREQLRRLGLRAPIALVPNGVDVPELLPGRDRRAARRALFLSRVHPKKGLPMLIKAWSRVAPPGWELVIAGPDDQDHRGHVEALVAQVGFSEAIHFHGPVSDADKWALYRSADLFVLPTHSENFGLVIAEALGAGVPVLTTRGAPWRELKTHRCGWWTDVSVDAIATALADATRMSRADLDAMGERGRTLVLDKYGWDDIAGQMKAVYEWILGQGDRPSCVYLG